jgi:hypothetical protein
MLYEDVRNYLSETARSLKPGGRCAISFYLLNDESRKNMANGQGALEFKYPLHNCVVLNEETPEDAVAFDEQLVREIYKEAGLSIREPILYGTWSSSKVQSQDIIIAYKS